MPELNPEQLLSTTRSVRKRLDLTRPVEPALIRECLELAIQAPSGSNMQRWHFVVVTAAEKRARIAALYRQSFVAYAGGDEAAIQRQRRSNRLLDSAMYLAEHMQDVPVLVIPCHEGRVENGGQMEQAGFYGSILPATWSFMLALRLRGLGSAWTTLHLRHADEVAALLGIPPDVTQAALLPVAWTRGTDFRPARRRPARESTWWNAWGAG